MFSTYQDKEIDEPIDEVWNRIKNFHDFSWAPDVITSLDVVGDVDGESVGAKRVLNGAFCETLIELDHNAHLIKYSIDDGPTPVSKDEVFGYRGTIKLTPVDNGEKTHIEWSSAWDSNKSDAVSFCSNIYTALLNQLDESFHHEQKVSHAG